MIVKNKSQNMETKLKVIVIDKVSFDEVWGTSCKYSHEINIFFFAIYLLE